MIEDHLKEGDEDDLQEESGRDEDYVPKKKFMM